MHQSEFLCDKMPRQHKTIIFFVAVFLQVLFTSEGSCLMNLGSSYNKGELVVVVTPTYRFIASCYVLPSGINGNESF